MAVTETPPETVDASAPTAAPSPRVEPSGLAAVLGSGDHKVVGRLYIVTSLVFGLAAVVLGALFAFEGIEPTTLEVFSSGSVYQLFTLFRIGTVFLVAFPLVIGVALAVVPLQVGASTVAFPRAAAASYWAWLVGSVLVIAAYAIDGGPGGGSRTGVNLFLAAMVLVVVAILVAALCLATTVIALRTTGLRLSRIPLYSWSVGVAAVMWLLTLPVLVASLVLAYVDHRHAGGVLGGNAAIFGRFAWVLRNPQIYVVAIPVLGFAADVQSVRVEGAVHLAAPAEYEVGRARPPRDEHSQLAVARKKEVVRAARVRARDLDRLLPLRGRPEAEVALPLQRDALAVEAPCDRHVSIESAEGGGLELVGPAVEARV